MKYSLFIGRWQPWHEGHQWLIDQRLNEGKNVLLGIRDIETDENQPWTAEEIQINLQEVHKELIKQGRIKVIILPDIESVNYGRGVGYEILEHAPPENIHEISATKIREQMRKDGKL